VQFGRGHGRVGRRWPFSSTTPSSARSKWSYKGNAVSVIDERDGSIAYVAQEGK